MGITKLSFLLLCKSLWPQLPPSHFHAEPHLTPAFMCPPPLQTSPILLGCLGPVHSLPPGPRASSGVSWPHSASRPDPQHSWNVSALFLDGGGGAWNDGAFRDIPGGHVSRRRSSLFCFCFPTVIPSTMLQARSENVLIYQANPLSPLTSISLSLKEVCRGGGWIICFQEKHSRTGGPYLPALP